MAKPQTFLPLPERFNVPGEEEKTLKYWEEIDAFQECLRQSKGKKPYNFYDGPPFATGLPHYGHILAGTIKDVVCRYSHQRGFHVERSFGWDCHGLPVESEIDKKLNIQGKGDVMKIGIDTYNEECRSIVLRYTGEWKQIVTRFGRWIDFDKDYKTMDLHYMESLWWVFKQLFDKGMVYPAFRVMPYSTALNTTLANFEVQQNYMEVSDPSVIVQFKTVKDPKVWILAWTTTPWTLPSNIALCVNPELDYLKVKKKWDGETWFVGKDRFDWVCSCIKKDPKKDFELLETVKGAKLVGTQYQPLFDYFAEKVNKDKAFRILGDGYVSTEAGTCIVHQAPAFGEDDNRVCVREGLVTKDGKGMPYPVDESGCYTDDVPDFKGVHVKKADKGLEKKLKDQGNLVWSGNIVHNYPHCWRSDTPLIYRAVQSWFINVVDIREKLIANNNKTHWVPEFVQTKRFHNWLAEARDWCVSRTRYWGTPIPLWASADLEEIVCIGSIAELEEYAGRKITDLHKHKIDDITIPSKKGKGQLRRIEDVFDCWFESGSMPYASKHYPFENKDTFMDGFPAHFCAEGLDQTRGWFYTLMVLSTHLFDQPAFKNLIVNGLVLAEDGKKMSKRLKNYPDPVDVCNKHGADAVRLYMCNSPVVRAEPLKFREDGVRDVVKDVFLPWYNAYRFLVQEVGRYEGAVGQFKPDVEAIKKSDNITDKWINASMHELIKFVIEEMEAYRLYTVSARLTALLTDLTNWYVRCNRDRMRGTNGVDEAFTSLTTLFTVLLNVTVLMAPLTPFITELMYQNLSRALPDGHPMKAKSVHFVMIPEADPEALNPGIMTAMGRMQGIVELGRTCRERKKVGLKTPLTSMTIMNNNPDFVKDIETLSRYVKEELNVEELSFKGDYKVQLEAVLNFKVLGKKLGKDMKAVAEAAKSLSQEDLSKAEAGGDITIAGHTITSEEMAIKKQLTGIDDPNIDFNGDGESLVVLDFTFDEDLARKAISRDVVNRVQKLRKDTKLQQDDPVDMWASVKPGKKSMGELQKVLAEKSEFINKLLRRNLWPGDKLQGHELLVKREEFELEGDILEVFITATGPHFNQDALKKLTGGDAQASEALRQYVQTFSLPSLTAACEGKGEAVLKLNVGGKDYLLKHKEHFSIGPSDAPWLHR